MIILSASGMCEGGRVLLPMECFTPGVGNTCGTGAFGVADPATLAFRYYVKLDPADIPKALESAERAIDVAAELARTHGAELLLLHVYMDLPAYPEVSAGQVEAIYEEQRRWVEDALEQRGEQLVDELARELNVDAVVEGSVVRSAACVARS